MFCAIPFVKLSGGFILLSCRVVVFVKKVVRAVVGQRRCAYNARSRGSWLGGRFILDAGSTIIMHERNRRPLGPDRGRIRRLPLSHQERGCRQQRCPSSLLLWPLYPLLLVKSCPPRPPCTPRFPPRSSGRVTRNRPASRRGSSVWPGRREVI